MALRKTLNEVVEAIRLETRKSTNTSRGVDHRDHIKQLVKRHYQMLAEDYDWQHLVIKRDSDVSRVVLQAGERYYNFPTALNPLKVSGAWVKWGSVWQKLEYGISYPHRSALDPDNDDRADPITNWMFYGGAQFEVWPIPSSDGEANGTNEVAFEGQKKVEVLSSDSSRLDMDDILVELMVSSEILAMEEQETAAKVKSQAASARLEMVRGNLSSQTRYAMGLGRIGDSSHAYPRHPKYVR